MGDYDESFPGGWPALLRRWQKRRKPLTFLDGESLPPLDVDLDELERTKVTEVPELGAEKSLFTWRNRNIAQEFLGCSMLAMTNALLIIALRKREWPDHAPALFNRLWREKHKALQLELNRRWLISSVITFADHGETETDRRVGQSLNILFSLMKLYEAERLYSGKRADEPFSFEAHQRSPLPMGMPPFALLEGDLDINLIAPIKADAKQAGVAGPLASHLLQLLNYDDSTLFRRLALMREDGHAIRAENEIMQQLGVPPIAPEDPAKSLD